MSAEAAPDAVDPPRGGGGLSAFPGSPDGARAPEEVSLAEIDRNLQELRALTVGLDSFGDERTAAPQREVDHPGDEGLACRVTIDRPDQADVELHEIWLKLEDVTEAREPGAGVVDRGPDGRPESIDRSTERVVVGDRHVLGDFQDDRCRRLTQQVGQPVAVEHQVGRHVQAEEHAGRQLARGGERRREGRGFELEPKPDGRGIREVTIRPRAVGEASQGLVADGRIRGQIHDRLEDGMKGTLRDRALDELARGQRLDHAPVTGLERVETGANSSVTRLLANVLQEMYDHGLIEAHQRYMGESEFGCRL